MTVRNALVILSRESKVKVLLRVRVGEHLSFSQRFQLATSLSATTIMYPRRIIGKYTGTHYTGRGGMRDTQSTTEVGFSVPIATDITFPQVQF